MTGITVHAHRQCLMPGTCEQRAARQQDCEQGWCLPLGWDDASSWDGMMPPWRPPWHGDQGFSQHDDAVSLLQVEILLNYETIALMGRQAHEAASFGVLLKVRADESVQY